MQNCCKGDEPCQWNTPIFRPSEIRNPLTVRHETWQGWLRRALSGISPTSKFRYFYPKGDGSAYAWNCHRPCLFLHPRYFFIACAPVEIAQFVRFSCFMAQKTCFGDSYVTFGMRTKNFNNFHYFSQKTLNSLFPQCKTSIGNNSSSIKDRPRVVKFAYSMGFPAIADRMVWPPSLSRDRKWPRPPIRRKTTLWMRVTAIVYKIERSVMSRKMCFSRRHVIFGMRTKIFNNFY